MRLYFKPGCVSRAVDADGNAWYRHKDRVWRPFDLAVWQPVRGGGASPVGTGENAHPELQALRDLVGALDEPVEIRVPHELEDYQVRLIEALGGRVVIDPRAPPLPQRGHSPPTRAERRRRSLPVYEPPAP